MILISYVIIVAAIANSYWDYLWYVNKFVPIPFVSVVSTTCFATAVWLLLVATRRLRFALPPGGAVAVLFLLACAGSGISLVLRSAPQDHYIQFAKSTCHLAFYLFFVGTIFTGLRQLSVRKIGLPIIVFGLPVCLLALWQWLTLNTGTVGLPDTLLFGCPLSEPEYGFRRVAGVFPEPSWFGFALVDWIGIAFALLPHSLRKTAIHTIIAAFLFCLCMANSMGAYASLVGLICVLGFELLRGRERLRFFVWAASVIVVIGTMLFIISDINFSERLGAIFTGEDPSTHMRVSSTSAAIKTWMLSPIFGVGFGNGQFIIPQFFESEFLLRLFQTGGFATSYGSDSFWALLLAETGLIGALGFILMFGIFLRKPCDLTPREPRFPNDFEWAKLIHAYLTVRAVVIVQVLQLSFQGSFLSPRLWFYVAILLVLKERVILFRAAERQANRQ